MYCVECCGFVEAESQFCGTCGHTQPIQFDKLNKKNTKVESEYKTFCPQCGKAVEASSPFCGGCGSSVSSGGNTREASKASINAITAEQAEIAFVGKNIGYYQKKWSFIDDSKYKPSRKCWNWVACLLPVLWLAYRKMYIYAAIMGAFTLFLSVADIYSILPSKLIISSNFAILLSSGFHANSLYRFFVKKKVADIIANNKSANVEEVLASNGGVSIIACILAAVAVSAPVGLMLFFGNK